MKNLPTLAGTKIDGLEVAKSVKTKVVEIVNDLKSKEITPCLATIVVGDNPASATYVRNKHKACEEVGILTKDHTLSNDITQEELNALIEKLNQDETVHGILVQLPLPNHLNEFNTTTQILPEKDIDGLTPTNVGLLAIGKAILIACTPSGIIEMCKYYNIELEGKNITIINRSNLVGKPLFHLLLQNNATVTTCHSKTKNLKQICLNSDIIITGVGNREIFKLTPDMIKQEAVVIDVATTRYEGKLVGDTDFLDIIEKALFASPVPGGVGPMTVAMLLKNTVTAAALSKGIDIKY
jgi:methylenetetrahydrofolate dehydrogenase (NADP+)/methenyltetrahydrofolate cyclohydrolase